MKSKSILLLLLAISLVPLVAKAAADLSIQITVTPQSPQIGNTIQYHCVVTNNGPSTATGINGYFGPDNSDGGCNPQNPSASCDKYTNFVSSDPAPFFTDPTNFHYVRLKQNGQVVQQLASGESGTFDVNYQATANGTAHRLIGVNSPDDSTPANNSQNVATTISVAPPACTNAPPGLVSWWRGEGNANDYRGTNHGVLNGAVSYPAAVAGQGFGLNGNDQKIFIGNPASLQLQDFTIDAWIKRGDTQIVSFDPAGPFQLAGILAGGNGGWGFDIAPDGTLGLTKVGVSGVSSPGAKITDTNFHHVAVSKSGSTVTFYVDGVAATADPYDPGFTFNSANSNTYIGYFGSGGGEFYGTIDEVHFFSRGLTASEVHALYSADGFGICLGSDYDAVRDFNSTLNTAAQTWQYGYTDTSGLGFTNYEEVGNGITYQVWQRPGGASNMGLVFNGSGQNFDYNICTTQQPDVLALFPGNDGRKTIVRWKAPATGTYSLVGRFQNIDHSSSDAAIVRNGSTTLFSAFVDAPGTCHQTVTVKSYSLQVYLSKDDTLDFRLGWGSNNEYSYDGTGLAAKITRISACPIGQTDCGGACINSQTDSNNCGQCGLVCPPGTTCGNGTCVPIAPPHGGLSATKLTIDGSDQPAYPPAAPPVTNLADTVLRFAATQTGTASNPMVRMQATTTPGTEMSWTDLDDGRKGRMTYDKTRKAFLLNTLSYPTQNGIYFRSISSASGYPDSISNVVGPFNLVSNKSSLGGIRLYMLGNGSIADFYFRAIAATFTDGMALRVQSSTTPDDELSWSDINNNSQMTHSTNANYPRHFLLLANNLPGGQNVYFRAIGSLSGYRDSISNRVGPFNLTSVTPPKVTLLPPAGLSGSGDGHDLEHPILVNSGSFHFGVTVDSSRPTKVKLKFDGGIVADLGNVSSGGTDYTSTVLGDHILEAFAVDDLGSAARAGTGPVYIRLVPVAASRGLFTTSATAAGKVYTAVNDGDWNFSSTWQDQNQNHGVPGPDDVAIINRHTVGFSGDVTVRSITVIAGGLQNGFGELVNLNVLGSLTMTDKPELGPNGVTTVVGPINIVIESGAKAQLLNNYSPVRFSGGAGLYIQGDLKLRGAIGVGGITSLNNLGTITLAAPLAPPFNANVDPSAPIRLLQTTKTNNFGKIVGDVRLIGSDAAGLIGSDAAGLVNPNGGTLIGSDAAGLIGSDAAGLIGASGSTLIGSDAAGLIGSDAAGRADPKTQQAATTDGFVQNSGETDLSGVVIAGPVTINGGSLTGSGVIAGDVTNNAYLAPGHSAGAIVVAGNYTQGAQGTLIIENGGAGADQHDQLIVNGNATLDGALHIRDIDGYTPDPADTFSPLAYTSMNGAFASVSSNAHVTAATTGLLTTVNGSVAPPPTGQPTNISTRMKVQTQDNVLIGGFIVTGPSGSTKKVLIHGLGPSLSSAGLSGLLSDPLLEFHYPGW